jgi:hypothetical protein
MISRRAALRSLAASAAGLSTSGWFSSFANHAHAASERKRNCILLWMAGGPSQTDTFDLKPDHENGGEFKEISRTVGSWSQRPSCGWVSLVGRLVSIGHRGVTTFQQPGRLCLEAEESVEERSLDAPVTTVLGSLTGRSTSPMSWPRSAPRWVWLQKQHISQTLAGPSQSSTARPSATS